MSSVRQKMAAVNKAAMKEEEAKLNGNQPIINEDANNEAEKVEKKAVKKTVAKVKKTEAKAKKTKAVVKTKAKVIKKAVKKKK
jgi:hypothetical protein